MSFTTFTSKMSEMTLEPTLNDTIDTSDDELDTLMEYLSDKKEETEDVEIPKTLSMEKREHIQTVLSHLTAWKLDMVQDEYFEIYLSDTDQLYYRNFDDLYDIALYIIKRSEKIIESHQLICKFQPDVMRIYF